MWLKQKFSVEALLGLLISTAILGCVPCHCRQITKGGEVNNSPSCPGDQLYFPPTRKCYNPGTSEPCRSPYQVSEFVWFGRSAENEKIGECRCLRVFARAGEAPYRPTLYVKESSQCCPIFYQGPCKDGEWVVAGDGKLGVCEKIPCPEKYHAQNLSRPEELKYEKVFLFADQGECMTTGDRCNFTNSDEPDGSKQIYINDETLLPECIRLHSERRVWEAEIYASHLSFSETRCSDGYEPDGHGGCEPMSTI